MTRDGITRRHAVATLAFAILVCLIVAGAASTRFFGIVELNGFDRLIGVQGEPRPIAQIAFVDITDATVNEIGAWPIPRGVIAQVIRRIAEGQPELIGLDMQVLRAAALDVGLVNMYPDEDGAIRRVPLALRVRKDGGKNFELLGFAAVLGSNFLGVPLTPSRPGVYGLGATEIRLDERPGDIPSILIGEWGVPGLRLDMLEVRRSPPCWRWPLVFSGWRWLLTRHHTWIPFVSTEAPPEQGGPPAQPTARAGLIATAPPSCLLRPSRTCRTRRGSARGGPSGTSAS